MQLFAKTTLLPLGAALLLSGCWTPPNADVRPPGPPRVIQKDIVVKSAIRLGVVQSVDAATRTVVMQAPGISGVQTYTAGWQVGDLGRLHEGTKVQATVSEQLTVYVASDGTEPPAAKVLTLDPSFRLLTLQSRDGGRETFKVGLDVRLDKMHAGDDVRIQTAEIVTLAVR